MSALQTNAEIDVAGPVASDVGKPANSNVRRDQPGIERGLLITFFAILAGGMLAWIALLTWGLFWILGWA